MQLQNPTCSAKTNIYIAASTEKENWALIPSFRVPNYNSLTVSKMLFNWMIQRNYWNVSSYPGNKDMHCLLLYGVCYVQSIDTFYM